MGVARSSFYDAANAAGADDTALIARMKAVQDEYPASHEGVLVKLLHRQILRALNVFVRFP
jgi:hypothetical protein